MPELFLPASPWFYFSGGVALTALFAALLIELDERLERKTKINCGHYRPILTEKQRKADEVLSQHIAGYGAPQYTQEHLDAMAALSESLKRSAQPAEANDYEVEVPTVSPVSHWNPITETAPKPCKHRRRLAYSGSGWICRDCGEHLGNDGLPEQLKDKASKPKQKRGRPRKAK